MIVAHLIGVSFLLEATKTTFIADLEAAIGGSGSTVKAYIEYDSQKEIFIALKQVLYIEEYLL